ncbi:uncharacterized protein BX664DRAFT_54908 [Halteromyces radiatus]|uniref:uncharacterized protein n=1 Tax=Halteromyces radiatus TaxID=101107 RepID=UPI00221F4216|nr:uncharacterized protein BX664DRAFT_54908 [Halteromyces radiatus]KAI8096224.1 hypothetical protein BX664DRAFT_54908 [Halteromyces radiatus]
MVDREAVLKLLQQRHCVFLKPIFYDDWLKSQPTLASNNLEQHCQALYRHFLNSDITVSSQPVLQNTRIPPKMVLQLQDTTDTSHSLFSLVDDLDKNGKIKRGHLKWIMTDGTRDIMVYELEQVGSMQLLTPFGSKVLITSAQYMNGLLLVKPENMTLLGGQVRALYGDTMEKELQRRFNKKLDEQTTQRRTTSNSISTAQNRANPPKSLSISRTTTTSTSILSPLPSSSSSSSSQSIMRSSSSFQSPEKINSPTSTSRSPSKLSLRTAKRGNSTTKNSNTTTTTTITNHQPITTVQTSTQSVHDVVDYPGAEDLIGKNSKIDRIDDGLSTNKPITVPELRMLLQNIDENKLTEDYDKVTVQIQGCVIRTMKVIPNKGIYLTVELLEHSHDKKIIATFMYNGIDSLYEGYTLEELSQMRKTSGVHTVTEKVFAPLRRRFNNIRAELEIDLTLTMKDDKYGLIRKGIKFTPLPSL